MASSPHFISAAWLLFANQGEIWVLILIIGAGIGDESLLVSTRTHWEGKYARYFTDARKADSTI